jgi:rod shape-determining protein MreD
MPRLLLGLAMMIAMLLQSLALPVIGPLQVRPNLVLSLLLLWTIARGGAEGALWAFGAGLLLDLLTLGTIGEHGLALIAAVLIGRIARTPRFRLGLVPPMIAALLATLGHDLVLLLIQGGAGQLPASLLRLSLLSGILTLAATPLLSLFTAWLAAWQLDNEATFGRPPPPHLPGRSPRR